MQMRIEFNRTADCWQFRIGDSFADFRGVRSFPTVEAWRTHINSAGMDLTRVNRMLYEVVAVRFPNCAQLIGGTYVENLTNKQEAQLLRCGYIWKGGALTPAGREAWAQQS